MGRNKRGNNDRNGRGTVERKFRRLPVPEYGPPSSGTAGLRRLTTANDKRLKILALHLDNGKLVLDQVQLRGKSRYYIINFLKLMPSLSKERFHLRQI